MNKLDRAGTFQAIPYRWAVKPAKDEQSKSISVAIEFKILAQKNGDDFESWEEYEDHFVNGYFAVVKRDGTVNTYAVQQLVEAIGWDMMLSSVNNGQPPKIACQIVVEQSNYNGQVSFRVKWLNPIGFEPQPARASEAEVAQMESQYGGLLRAAGSKFKPPVAAPEQPQMTNRVEPPQPIAVDDDLPF